MRFADLTYLELRNLQPRVAAVLIPLGCTEQQGPHLPVNFDAWMVERLCDGVAERLEREQGLLVLTMPTLPFGPTPEHTGFGHGYVNLRQSTHEAVVEDVLESLADQGFESLIAWRGCGQHELSRPISTFNTRHVGSKAYQPVIDYGRISQAAFGEAVPGGHADSFATSIRMYLDAERVRMSELKRPRDEAIAIDWREPLDFARFSDTGVIGDPTHASADAGAAIWGMCVEAGSQIVLDLLRGTAVEERWQFS